MPKSKPKRGTSKQSKKTRARATPSFKSKNGECLIPGAMPIEAVAEYVVSEQENEANDVRSYVEWQSKKDKRKSYPLGKSCFRKLVRQSNERVERAYEQEQMVGNHAPNDESLLTKTLSEPGLYDLISRRIDDTSGAIESHERARSCSREYRGDPE